MSHHDSTLHTDASETSKKSPMGLKKGLKPDIEETTGDHHFNNIPLKQNEPFLPENTP